MAPATATNDRVEAFGDFQHGPISADVPVGFGAAVAVLEVGLQLRLKIYLTQDLVKRTIHVCYCWAR